jgi:murein DD-endopeptidase MepM/ murein hydrolase activator NlpD
VKYNTIIFVPHARARFRKLTISTRFLAVASGSVAAILLAAVGFAWAYFASAGRDREYRFAMAENARLRSTTRDLHQRLDGISKRMSDFETRTRRLAIVAGLTDSARSGVGGPVIAPESSLDGRRQPDWTRQSALLDTRLSMLEKQFSRRTEQIASTPTVWPVRGSVSSGYGLRTDPFNGSSSAHEGIDISTSRGEPVLATADGKVLLSGWAGEYGRAIEIVHNDRYVTLFGHLDQTLVKEGQIVHRGDRVGLVGSTGRSTAPHLHYEVRVDGRPVNPLEYILESR